VAMMLTAGLDATLRQIGPRLRQARAHRGRTLTDVAEQTGISKSTLSRLESGQRRPSLELLLPLASAYRVPLDDLVGAPEVGDPRIRLKPHSRNGRTVVPLSRQPGAVQTWKVVIPAMQATPALDHMEASCNAGPPRCSAVREDPGPRGAADPARCGPPAGHGWRAHGRAHRRQGKPVAGR